MRLLLSLLGLAAATGGVAAQVAGVPAGAPVSRQVRSITGPTQDDGLARYVVDSDYQSAPANLYVLLPDRLDKDRKYKVLFVLPVWSNEKTGMLEARKLDLANKYDVICVGPDFVTPSWYADHPMTPRMLYDSYLPEVVVPFLDRTFPTMAGPEGRILVGFSKSGVGAVTELLRHPDVFGRAGAFDAPIMEDTTRPEYYGPQDYFTKNYYIPGLLARQAEVFRGKPARLAVTGHGFGSTGPAHELMLKLGIPHYCDEAVRLNHEWSGGWLGPLVRVLMAEDMTK